MSGAGSASAASDGDHAHGDELTATPATDELGSMASLLSAVARPAAGALLAPGALVADQFRVVRILGEGGMGVVYQARDERLGRDVALKLGTAATPAALARAGREALALARLSHPNVVVVFQVGDLGGRIYLAMEYVAGGSARQWAQARRRSWREVVALYAAAGDGLAAAHAAGLVHRDFKPDNVLVGDDGRARVADFGLARDAAPDPPDGDGAAGALGAAVTQTGTVVGTPAYMAPEQLAGHDVDPRADQFAFAVSLWEALFDELPFAAEALTVGERRGAPRPTVEYPVPRPPADRARAVPRHLIAALARALQPDPAARWPSMAALLAELRRDPAARRRRVALVGAIAAAAVVPLWLRSGAVDPCTGGPARLAPIWSAARAARLGDAFAAAGAGESWPALRARLDAYARAWLVAHRDACRAARVDEVQSDAMLDRRMICLDRAASQLDAVTRALEQHDRAAIGRAAEGLALLPDLSACADAAALAQQAPPPADPARRARIASVTRFLADVRTWITLGQVRDQRAVAAAVAGAAQSTGYAPTQLDGELLRAQLLAGAGDTDAAELVLGEAGRAAIAAGADEQAGWAFADLAWAVADDGRADSAATWLGLAEAEWRRAGSPPSLGLRLRGAAMDQAQAADQPAARIAAARQALAESRRLFGADPIEEALARSNLAVALSDGGEPEEAAREIAEAQALAAAAGADQAFAGMLAERAAAVALASGRLDDAEAAARRAIAIDEAWFGADDARLAPALVLLGDVRMVSGDLDAARAAFTRAQALLPAGQRRLHAGVELDLAVIASMRGDQADALAHGERVLAAREEVIGPDALELVPVLNLLGIASRELGRIDDSERYLRRALAVRERAFGAGAAATVNDRIELSYTLTARGRAAEALDLLGAVADVVARDPSVQPRYAAEYHLAVAKALWAQGRERERARAEAAAARDAFAALGPRFAGERAAAEAWLRGR